MMHGLRASWAGQTFALAKSNDSGDKKSRIRRSKEERKTMVESFIKGHQKLNNGSFPSLSLTHKEVGGSFYIVREIVREIIQENKVLGTSKVIREENDTHQQQEQDLYGPLLSLNYNSHFKQDQQEVPEENPETSPENGQYVNGSHVDVEKKEPGRKLSEPFEDNGVFGSDRSMFDEQDADPLLERNSYGESEVSLSVSCEEIHLVPEHDKLQDSFSPESGNRRIVNMENEMLKNTMCSESKAPETFEVEKTVKELPAANSEATNVTEGTTGKRVKVTDISTSVVVETFPLSPVTPIADFGDGRLSELENASRNPKQNQSERADIVADNGSAKPFDPVEIALTSSGLLEGKVDGETKDSPSKKAFTLAGNRASNSTQMRESRTGTSSPQTIKPNQPAANTQKKKTLPDATAKVNSAMLNRSRLEMWKKMNDDAAGTEPNPLSAMLKSFITAFLRFWSE